MMATDLLVTSILGGDYFDNNYMMSGILRGNNADGSIIIKDSYSMATAL